MKDIHISPAKNRECSSAAFPEDAPGLLHLRRVDT